MNSYRLEHLRRALGDRYSFEAFLGRGAFASVYLVRNLKLKRLEALKILSDAYEPDSGFAERFIAEAQTVAALDHPHIVQVYDYGEVDHIVWISMQYIEGPTLRAELAARNKFTPSEALAIFIPLLTALEASHRRGIIHRDVKPANIILNRQGRPFLMDFGVAKTGDSALKTQTGSVLGTPAYMAPEQAEGRPLDGRADLYSLGLCLYEALAGRLPFVAAESVPLLLQRLQQEPDPISRHQPNVPPELEAILMRTLERDRERRFATAAELRQRLLAFLGDEEEQGLVVTAPPAAVQQLSRLPSTETILAGHELFRRESTAATVPGSGPTLAAPRPRPPLLRWATLALVAAAGLAALGFLWQGRHAPEPAAAEPIPAASAPATAPATAASPPAAEPVTPPSTAPPPPPPRPTAARPPREDSTEPLPRRAVVVPRLLEQPAPELSPAQLQLCAGTAAILSVKVGADGRATSARAIGRVQAECAAAAIAAVRRYLFSPGLDAQGQPIEAATTLSIRFGEGAL